MDEKIKCSIGEKEYLTQKELEAWLGVGYETVDKLRANGLVYMRIGDSSRSRILFSKKHVRECLKNFEV